MAIRRAARSPVSELSQFIQAWDEITQRLWKGRKYSNDVLDDPTFRAFAERQHNILPATVKFVRDFQRQFNPSSDSPGELSERQPTHRELVQYARQYDRLRLLTVLEKLNVAAEERGIDPSALINFRIAMKSNAESEQLGDAAWTTVERLRNRASIEQADRRENTAATSPTAKQLARVRAAIKRAGKSASPKLVMSAMKQDNSKGQGMKQQPFRACLKLLTERGEFTGNERTRKATK